MTTTPNRHYSIPNRHHDVVDDINDMRTTFGKVDEDIVDIENAVTGLASDVSDAQDLVVRVTSGTESSEIQNIAANRYLVVNSDGDGFECLDGGGDAGGSPGQCSIKKSDQSFDTAWGDILNVSKNGMIVQENKETSQSGETLIFVDETEIDNDKQLPKVELTNCQAKSDFVSDSNSSVIVCDNVEEVNENIQVATNVNYGLVKVGGGLSVDNGTLSAPIYSPATVDDFGLVKTGSGLNNNDGVISYDSISPATFSSFGVVKLGENLKINTNGEMEIDEMGISATIYDLGNVKVCRNGVVDLEESTLRYRLFLTQDLIIHFALDFEPRDDFSFVLELISDGTRLVAFNENLYPKMSTLPINRGTTKITFTKKQGVPYYNFEISKLEAPEPVLLTPAIDGCISSEFSVTSGGGSWMPNQLLRTYYDGYCDINELNFKFETLVCVDYVNYISLSSSDAMGEFILKGSNDGKNWTTLLYRNDEVIYGKVYTDIKGCFRYFNLKIGYTTSGNYPGGITLWGTQIDNNESEITPLTPYMGSNETTFATMTTSNNIVEGSASSVTDNSSGSYLIMEKTNDNWIKFEFPTAKVANILELNYWFSGNSWSYAGGNQPNWFRLFGSNDDSTWTLLLERQYQGSVLEKENNVLFYSFDNSTAYKYYKFVCVATRNDSSRWNIVGLKLYRRSLGKHNFYNLVPTLSSNSQDGYEVTASSQFDSSHLPFYVFNGNTSSKWASASDDSSAWLQIKLPTASACNVVEINSGTDGDFYYEVPTDFEIQGSNDEELWTVLSAQTGISWTAQGQTQSFNFENETAYQYYRLYMTANARGSGVCPYSLGGLVFGRAMYEYKRFLDSYAYSVPVMSSDLQDGYQTSADSRYSGNYPASRAFDRNDGSSWTSSDATSTTPHWLMIYNNDGIAANYISVVWHSSHYGVDYVISGSNDGATYTDLVTVTDNNNLTPSYQLSNTQTFKYWRIYITRINTNAIRTGIHQFNLINKNTVQEY